MRWCNNKVQNLSRVAVGRKESIVDVVRREYFSVYDGICGFLMCIFGLLYFVFYVLVFSVFLCVCVYL